MVIEEERVWIMFLPGPLDFPSLLLGHPKLVGVAGSYSVSVSAPAPCAQPKNDRAAEGGKRCAVGSTNGGEALRRR